MARFIEIAYGSLLESVTNFEIAKRQQFVNPASCAEAYRQAERLAKMLSGLRRTIRIKKTS
jgi:four helix bundle protein